MNTQLLLTIATPIIIACIGYALSLAQTWVNTHVKSEAGLRWTNGALSFAGQAYLALMSAQRASPTTPLPILINKVVDEYSDKFRLAYQPTGVILNASPIDARTRVSGALGELLAADPSISVGPPIVPVATGLSLNTDVRR